LSQLLGRSDVYSVVAELDDRIVGSNFLWENAVIAGVGPITVDPAVENVAVGRSMMEDVLRRAHERRFVGVRRATVVIAVVAVTERAINAIRSLRTAKK
jgi:predicted N-acetyltransferase YhbS